MTPNDPKKPMDSAGTVENAPYYVAKRGDERRRFPQPLGNASRFHRAHRLLLAHNQENKKMFESRLW